VVICLERGVNDLHVVQLMLLPLPSLASLNHDYYHYYYHHYHHHHHHHHHYYIHLIAFLPGQPE